MPRRRYSSSEDSSASDDSVEAKKSKKSESHGEIEQRLESLICRIGEKSTSSLESNLEGLGKVLKSDLANFKDYIIETLTCAAYQMPEKLTIYSTLVGWLNAKSDQFGADFMKYILSQLQDMIVECRWEAARYMVRFVADLANCGVFSYSSLVSFIDAFLEVLNEPNASQVRKDTFVFIILSALPWCGKTLAEKESQNFERILNSIDSYVRNRDKTHLEILRVWRTDKPHPQEDMVDALWKQLINMAKDAWDDNGFIPRPYIAFEGVLAEATRQSIPRFTLPPHEPEMTYAKPHIVFRLFDLEDCTEGDGSLLPNSDSIVRFLVEENLFQILMVYYRERKECASKFLSYVNKDRVPLFHMIVEVMFASMFRLPEAPMIDIAYATIFIELCKLQPSNMPQVLALATELLFERLDTMTKPAIDRFISWFGHHLSNFQFRWSWDEWADCLQQDLDAPKPAFIREVLEKCRRLAYHQRIVETVPQDFEPLLPQEPIIRFKYKQDEEDEMSENPAAACSRKLEYAIRSKASQEEILDILRDVPKPSQYETEEDLDYNPHALDVFMQTLMFLASKTFTHSFSALSKYHTMLKRLARNEGAKVQLLQILFDLWRNHPQMLVVLIDKCIRAQIVDPGSVARWIFSPEMANYFHRCYIWEILHGTIQKMNHHVARVEEEYESAVSRSQKAQIKIEDDEEQNMMNSYDAFAPTQQEVDQFKEKLQNSKAEQKNLFLIIFQRFIAIVTDHIEKHGPLTEEALAGQVDLNKHGKWLIGTVERLQEVFLKHEKVIVLFEKPLRELLFTSSVDSNLLRVFDQFKSLRN